MLESKRRDLIKLLIANGWYSKRDSGDHEIFTNGKASEPIPRHREIDEELAKSLEKLPEIK